MLALAFFLAITAPVAPELRLEIQRTPAEMRRGLQGHEPLAENEAMLFIFRRPRVAEFWMKDVTFPIDIVFLRENREIMNIAPSVPPCGSRPCNVYRSEGEASYVIELPAGWSQRYGLNRGDMFRLDVDKRRATFLPLQKGAQ